MLFVFGFLFGTYRDQKKTWGSLELESPTVVNCIVVLGSEAGATLQEQKVF